MTRLLARTNVRCVALFCFAIAGIIASGGARAGETLHERIDRLIEAPLLLTPAPPANDADFLRRLSLDLCNRIASPEEVRSFLSDHTTNKRQDLVDRMLSSPQFARRLANYLDVTLMERRRDKYVPGAEWENWLYQVCLDNRPWNQIVRDLLTADGADPARRPPAKFSLEREADPNLLTRDAGRMFFGRDVQCAQCHDHPIVKDFEQREYYGLLSFFQRTELFKDAKGVYVLAEKADGDAVYQSVFKAGSKFAARPALPGGAVEPEPRVESGKEYVVAPADKVRPVPTLSRRELLAKSATGGSNRAFNRNMANRLWAMMMGRGLVHPVDFDHADNPPTHPELLDLLADEFAALKYDMRAFLREIALTKTYQRSFDAPPNLDIDAARIVTEMSSLETGVARAEEALAAAGAAWKATRREAIAAQEAIDQSLVGLRAAETSLAGARKLAATASATLAASQQQNKAKTDANAAVAVALEQAKQALGNLATDADLKLVVEKLQTKSTQLASEIQNHAKTLQAQGEAAQKAIAAVEAAAKSVDELTAKAQQVEQQGEPALRKCNAARLDLQRAKAVLAVQERRRQTAKLVIEYRTKAELLAKAQTESGTAPNELDAARRAREEAAVRARVNRRRLTMSERELDALRKQMVVAKSALEARQPAVDALPAMTDQIEKTAATVKDDELTRAAAVVRNRTGALVAATAAARKQLADQETTCATLVAKCEALNKEKPALDQALAAAESRVSEIETQHKESLGNLMAARTQHDSARQNLLEALAESYAVAPLKPLSAEQLHWSVLQAAGILA
jgi:Protein of unknown function (DUF1549)/Protein of unknown function (DUF1553)